MRIQLDKTFLPSKLLMLDLEMTGLDPKSDDILQVAALKLELLGSSYVETSSFDVALHTKLDPSNDFQRKYQTALFDRCRNSTIDYQELKKLFYEFLGEDLGELSPCGDCVPTDVLFLYAKDVIELSRYEGDTPVKGTLHYEYFDMHSMKMVMRQKLGYKADKDLVVSGGQHDGLVDCRNQLIELNFILHQLLVKGSNNG